MAAFKPAAPVAKIGRQLIASVDDHRDLSGARIDYVFVDHATNSRGRPNWAHARRVTGLHAWLADATPARRFTEPEPFFVVEIAHDVWSDLTDAERVVLVDHELSHLAVTTDVADRPTLRLRHHDLEEFLGVITRNGLPESIRELVATGGKGRR